MDYKKLGEAFDALLEDVLNDDSVKRELKNQKKREMSWEKYIHKWVSTHNEIEIQTAISNLASLHDRKYRDQFYKKGIQPHPNNLLFALFNYVDKYGELDGSFGGDTPKKFSGFYFIKSYGQGTSHQIYNDKLNLILFGV